MYRCAPAPAADCHAFESSADAAQPDWSHDWQGLSPTDELRPRRQYAANTRRRTLEAESSPTAFSQPNVASVAIVHKSSLPVEPAARTYATSLESGSEPDRMLTAR